MGNYFEPLTVTLLLWILFNQTTGRHYLFNAVLSFLAMSATYLAIRHL